MEPAPGAPPPAPAHSPVSAERDGNEAVALPGLPYATPDRPGVGGALKRRPEDFFVQELPLYEASGEGEHFMLEVQKVNLTTTDAVTKLARHFKVNPRDIGYAGLKDKHAITRQLFTLPAAGLSEEKLMTDPPEGLAVLWAARHKNKLRLGHLAGNRFAVKIREVVPTDVVRLRPLLDDLARNGLPNYFGPQRFGKRLDNAPLGIALLRGDEAAVLDRLLGAPQEGDSPVEQNARQLWDRGDIPGAAEAWSRLRGPQGQVLRRLQEKGTGRAALKALPKHLVRLFESAAQSLVFNEVVADRLRDGLLAEILDGDVAMKTENGACFTVEDASAERPRVQSFEISATGPMFGGKMKMPGEAVAERERLACERCGLMPSDFDSLPGERRPLRIRPADTTLAGGVDESGPHITVAFSLPPGSFATVLLRELMKVG